MLLATFYINNKKVFELVLTRDKIKKTKNTVIQNKKFVKNADVKLAKAIHVVLDFFKL